MDCPLLSIIVPVYNSAAWLRPCLDSLCNQSYRNLEIICVNDCSHDNSADILTEYAARDPRLCIIYRDINGGLSAARNTGLDHAHGNIISFVDSDDYLDLNTYECCIPLMSEDVDCVCFGLSCEGADCARKQRQSDYFSGHSDEGRYLISEELLGRLPEMNSVCTKLFRRCLIEQYHLRFAEGYCYEDGDFSARYACVCRAVYILPQRLYHYRIREGSITDQTQRSLKIALDAMRVHQGTLRFMKETGLMAAKPAVLRHIINRLLEAYDQAIGLGFKRPAKKEMRVLIRTWGLLQVPLHDRIRERYLRSCASAPWWAFLRSLFIDRRLHRTSLRLFGIVIFTTYHKHSARRCKLLGFSFGKPQS